MQKHSDDLVTKHSRRRLGVQCAMCNAPSLPDGGGDPGAIKESRMLRTGVPSSVPYFTEYCNAGQLLATEACTPVNSHQGHPFVPNHLCRRIC